MIRIKAVVALSASAAAIAASLMLPDPVLAASLTLPTVAVPEPATTALVATGIAGVVLEARRRRKNRDD